MTWGIKFLNVSFVQWIWNMLSQQLKRHLVKVEAPHYTKNHCIKGETTMALKNVSSKLHGIKSIKSKILFMHSLEMWIDDDISIYTWDFILYIESERNSWSKINLQKLLPLWFGNFLCKFCRRLKKTLHTF